MMAQLPVCRGEQRVHPELSGVVDAKRVVERSRIIPLAIGVVSQRVKIEAEVTRVECPGALDQLAPTFPIAQVCGPRSNHRNAGAVERIQRQLQRAATRENPDGLNLSFFIDVYARAPRIELWTPEPNLLTGPAPYGAPTPRQTIEQIVSEVAQVARLVGEQPKA